MQRIIILFALFSCYIDAATIEFEVVSFVQNTNYTNKKKIQISHDFFDSFFKRSIKIEEAKDMIFHKEPRIFRGINLNGCVDSEVYSTFKEDEVDYHWITKSNNFCIPTLGYINNKRGDIFVGHWDSGKKNRITPLHFDVDHGLLWCYSGLKYVFLFPPDQHDLLSLGKLGVTGGSTTTIPFIIEEANKKNFPKFFKAKPYAVKMGKDDMLNIPAGWAHHVYTFNGTKCKTFWTM